MPNISAVLCIDGYYHSAILDTWTKAVTLLDTRRLTSSDYAMRHAKEINQDLEIGHSLPTSWLQTNPLPREV